MNLWEYLSAESDRSEQQRARAVASLQQLHWVTVAALVFGIVGAVLFGLSFNSERTETQSSGHLWWKDESTTTTEVSLQTRLILLFTGLALLMLATLCVYVRIKQAARRARQRRYFAILRGVEVMGVQQIADITDSNKSIVYRDIQAMIDSGVLDGFYIDYRGDQVHNRNYVPYSSHKTVVTCTLCRSNNELIVGITRSCSSCGEPLVMP